MIIGLRPDHPLGSQLLLHMHITPNCLISQAWSDVLQQLTIDTIKLLAICNDSNMAPSRGKNWSLAQEIKFKRNRAKAHTYTHRIKPTERHLSAYSAAAASCNCWHYHTNVDNTNIVRMLTPSLFGLCFGETERPSRDRQMGACGTILNLIANLQQPTRGLCNSLSIRFLFVCIRLPIFQDELSGG